MGLVQLWAICEVVTDYQHLIQLLHLQLLGCLGDLALPLDDAPQRCLVPLVVVGLFPLGINAQVLLYVLLDGDPTVVDIDGRTEDIDFLEDSAVLLQNHADQRRGFAGLAGAEEDARTWYQGHHGVRGLFAAVLGRRKQLDLPHDVPLPYLPNSTRGSRGSGGAGPRAGWCAGRPWGCFAGLGQGI